MFFDLASFDQSLLFCLDLLEQFFACTFFGALLDQLTLDGKLKDALSWLVAEAGDSWVHAVLQDENPQKGWPEVMSVSATIDNWQLEKHCITTINAAVSYQKLGLPADVAQFLASIPFEQQNGSTISYTFSRVPGNPSAYTNDVMAAMRKGSSRSRFVQANTREVKIEDRKGFVSCKVD